MHARSPAHTRAARPRKPGDTPARAWLRPGALQAPVVSQPPRPCPALTIRMRISFLAISLDSNRLIASPIVSAGGGGRGLVLPGAAGSSYPGWRGRWQTIGGSAVRLLALAPPASPATVAADQSARPRVAPSRPTARPSCRTADVACQASGQRTARARSVDCTHRFRGQQAPRATPLARLWDPGTGPPGAAGRTRPPGCARDRRRPRRAREMRSHAARCGTSAPRHQPPPPPGGLAAGSRTRTPPPCGLGVQAAGPTPPPCCCSTLQAAPGRSRLEGPHVGLARAAPGGSPGQGAPGKRPEEHTRVGGWVGGWMGGCAPPAVPSPPAARWLAARPRPPRPVLWVQQQPGPPPSPSRPPQLNPVDQLPPAPHCRLFKGRGLPGKARLSRRDDSPGEQGRGGGSPRAVSPWQRSHTLGAAAGEAGARGALDPQEIKRAASDAAQTSSQVGPRSHCVPARLLPPSGRRLR
jgi:hypothetical protein